MFGGSIYEQKEVNVENLEKAVAAGDLKAMNDLADWLYDEYENDESLERMFNLYKQAAEGGYADAYVGLGRCYEEGDGVEWNRKKAIEMYHKAAVLGSNKGMIEEALVYICGEIADYDTKKAVRLLNKAVKRGNIDALNLLVFHFQQGNFLKKNWRVANYYCKMGADRGMADNQMAYAKQLLGGLHIKRNVEEGLRYLRMASEHDGGKEAYNLGNMYFGDRDCGMAYKMYQIASDCGCKEASYKLGLFHMDGSEYNDCPDCFAIGYGKEIFPGGPIKDIRVGIEYFNKAGMAGNGDGFAVIGDVYFAGNGVEKDEAEALKWYQKAADFGDPYGMYRVGTSYRYAEGTEKDWVKGAEWLLKSAKAEYEDGQYKISRCYLFGQGVPKDLKKARYWLEKAIENGRADRQHTMELLIEEERKEREGK